MNIRDQYKVAVFTFIICFVGIGIGRYIYGPILPQMIRKHWFSQSDASYINAATFVGSVVGALIFPYIEKYMNNKLNLLLIFAFIASLGVLGCSFNFGFQWQSFSRFITGLMTGALMVGIPSITLPMFDKNKKSFFTCFIFMSIGTSIIIQGILLPVVLPYSILSSWMSIFVICIAAIIICSFLKRNLSVVNVHKFPKKIIKPNDYKKYVTSKLIVFIFLYTLSGIVILPQCVLMNEYVVYSLNYTSFMSNNLWISLGLGIVVLTYTIGKITIKIHTKYLLMLSYILALISLMIFISSDCFNILLISNFLLGGCVGSYTALSMSLLSEFVGRDIYAHIFRFLPCFASIGFAVGLYFIGYFQSLGYDLHTIFIGVAVIAFIEVIFSTLIVIMHKTDIKLIISTS